MIPSVIVQDKERKLSLIRQIGDIRDQVKVMAPRIIAERPKQFSMKDEMPNVYDQEDIGSCVANGVCLDIKYRYKLQGGEFEPSRLFEYWNARCLTRDCYEDTGTTIRNGMKAAKKWGICEEQYWIYETDKFAVKPKYSAFKDGLDHQALKYEAIILTPEQIESALFQRFPIVLGIAIYTSFLSEEVATNGVMPMPSLYDDNERAEGGHCITLIGYNAKTHMYIARNSWGIDWGKNGNFLIPY
ncbi:MAG TPA: C1 family peptidase, partial [Methanosarcinales archaeon]|nr:C1 family peptidase [Methanosarcinales archaeon]